MKRRTFLKNTAFASGSLLVPAFLKPLEAMASSQIKGNRNLVVIQLSGGNDGLNTIVPYGVDEYYKKRPTLALPASGLIKLDDVQGMNPAMGALRDIYDQGWMSIINNVGYPNPDRSHFRSMDIWQTASDADQFLSTGWIGRYLDSNCETCKFPYTALEVDDTLSLALKGQNRKGLAVKDPAALYRNTREPFFTQLINDSNDHLNEDNLGYLYKTMIETCSSAEHIQNKYKTYQTRYQYPETPFGQQLKTVSRFINSGLDTRVYYVSLSGFDTHIGQKIQQGRLLKQYADAVAAFVKDLKQSGKLDETLVLTFSEFGRRVEQNASNGTDHGTANNVFVFGGKLNKQGIYNAAPDLKNLSDGDLRYKIDFREIYATVLDKWLDTGSPNILSKKFDPLNFI
ncbi:MAG TPA: DUF1501 domain-containing protein [Sphingobacteriaceae bacterium]